MVKILIVRIACWKMMRKIIDLYYQQKKVYISLSLQLLQFYNVVMLDIYMCGWVCVCVHVSRMMMMMMLFLSLDGIL